MKIAVLPGDGVGPEVIAEARRVLDALSLPGCVIFEGDVGAAAVRRHGTPLPPETLDMAREADAVLFGAVGDPSLDDAPRHLRPERAILDLRRELGLFANLRPVRVWPGLEDRSPLRPERLAGLDLLIVRELTGDVYFGDKGIEERGRGVREGWDRMAYRSDEVARIAAVAFAAARRHGGRVTSVDKANVLETSRVWREAVVAAHDAWDSAPVALDHLYVDNAAMQLVARPASFGVVVTGNLFGDILSDLASACVGSIGLMPSASLGERRGASGAFGLYEPIHGSAPDIAGRGIANPLAAILSLALLLRHSFGLETEAARVEAAVGDALAAGVRPRDLGGTDDTTALGDAVLARL